MDFRSRLLRLIVRCDHQRLGGWRLGWRTCGCLRRCGRLRSCGWLVLDTKGGADVLRKRGHDVAARKASRRFLDLIEAFLEVGHFRLTHRFLKLALEFTSHLARLGHPLPDHAQNAW